MTNEDSMTCKVCVTDYDVPLCCETPMREVNGTLICHLCSSKKKLPICCGKELEIKETDLD